MPLIYSNAPEVEKVAKGLIRKHHAHLEECEVRFVFRSEAAKRGGQTVLGDAKKVSGLNSFFAHRLMENYPLPTEAQLTAPTFFAIVVAKDLWDLVGKTEHEALVDSLLCRCRTQESANGLRLTLAAPEAQEFAEVVARHGMWRDSLRKLVGAAYKAHPTLFAEDAADVFTITTGGGEDEGEGVTDEGEWEDAERSIPSNGIGDKLDALAGAAD